MDWIEKSTETDRPRYPEDDPRHHTAKLKSMLRYIADFARSDVPRIGDPRAQALFETTAEVATGLETACEHYENRAEGAWQ
jgi:hypothetical protein